MHVSRSPSTAKNLTIAVLLTAFFGFIGFQELSSANDTRVAKAVSSYVASVGETKNSDYYGAKRAQLAMQEYQRGVTEASPGCECGPQIDKYTEGDHAQWCTMFASWITKEAGSPFVTKTGGWRITNSRDLAEYLKKNGTWYSRDQIVREKIYPKPGDFIIYWRGDFNDGLGHVDIVVNSSNNSGYVETVGGNLRDSIKLRNLPYRDNYGFLGFGRPEKS